MFDEYTYGVCNYDLDGYNPQVKNLEQFKSSDEATKIYMKRFLEYMEKEGKVPDDLWFVYICDGCIRQFDRLDRIVKSRIVELKSQEN